MNPIVKNLGKVNYHEALEFMDALHLEVVNQPSHPGYILMVEHPPVVTMGNRERSDDMNVTRAELQVRGIDFAKIDRGGSVTIHEPGQIVIYPIMRLDTLRLTVKKFVWALEESIIRLCQRFEVKAERDSINPGVWVNKNKIAALGIRVKNSVSKHGLAFNFTNSLDTFRLIVPCGIQGRGVTCLKRETTSQLPEFFEVASEMTKTLIEIINKIRHEESI